MHDRSIAMVPPAGGALVAVTAAVAVVTVPAADLDGFAWWSGLALLVPPTRAVLASGAGLVAGAVGWAMLYLLWGEGGWLRCRPAAVRPVRIAELERLGGTAPPLRPGERIESFALHASGDEEEDRASVALLLAWLNGGPPVRGCAGGGSLEHVDRNLTPNRSC